MESIRGRACVHGNTSLTPNLPPMYALSLTVAVIETSGKLSTLASNPQLIHKFTACLCFNSFVYSPVMQAASGSPAVPPRMGSPSTSSSSTRSVLLRIPNAKASRLPAAGKNGGESTFLALGDLVAYQVAAAAPSSSSSPQLPHRRGSASPAATSTGAPPLSSRSETLPAQASAAASRPGIVLAVRNAEFPISPFTQTRFEQPNTYVLDNPDSYSVQIELDLPRTGSNEILDNLLRKYAQLGGEGSNDQLSPMMAQGNGRSSNSSSGASSPLLQPSDFKGSLLLVDETTGKILGPLEQSMQMGEANRITSTEAPNQMADGDPVVVNFPDENAIPGTPQAEITVSPFDNIRSNYGKSDSKIVGAAEYVSKGILFAAEYGANYTSKSAKDFTQRTKATDSPLVFSPTTKKG